MSGRTKISGETLEALVETAVTILGITVSPLALHELTDSAFRKWERTNRDEEHLKRIYADELRAYTLREA